MAARYVVKLTMEQAEQLGIVRCANCGWAPNNHWTTKPVKAPKGGSACAHAECPVYKPSFRTGKPIR